MVGAWIQYKFVSPVVIKKIATTNRNESNNRVIRTFIFQGSNDGETYVDLAECEIISNAGAYRQEFLINNDTEYLYYRLYVTEPWIPNDMTVGLAQLELYKEEILIVYYLNDLLDVNLVNPSEGQPLIYSDGKWINGGVIPIANGGTGNADGYIRTGKRANTNVGGGATILGANNQASGTWSYAEGYNNTASGNGAHVEGEQNTSSGVCSHAEGGPNTKAQGASSHAEGSSTTASGHYSHAEGASTIASGQVSHAEGNGTKATAANAHAQNYTTEANAQSASAAGDHTIAGYQNQFVIGKYNDNKSTSIFEVGNGTGALAKSNALELDTSGNLKIAGSYTNGDGNVLEPGEALTQAQMNSLLALIP